MKNIVLAAALVAAFVWGTANAAAPSTGFAYGSSSTATVNPPMTCPPAYLGTVKDGPWGTNVVCPVGSVGTQITGFIGIGADSAVWRLHPIPHYQKDPVWNASESLMWVLNGHDSPDVAHGESYTDGDGKSSVSRLMMNGATYAPDFTKSSYTAFRDSMTEMRWHPLWSNVAYMVYSTRSAWAGKTRVVMFDFARNKVLKSWMLPVLCGWHSEGNVSDDGRYTVLTTTAANTDTASYTTLVLLDFYFGTMGYDSVGTGHDSLGRWDTTRVAGTFPVTGPQGQDHYNLSAKSNYCLVKYDDTNTAGTKSGNNGRYPTDQGRILVRGNWGATNESTTPDTSVLKFRPMNYPASAIKFGVADSLGAKDGWTYPLSHSCMGVDVNGREVLVGGARPRISTSANAVDNPTEYNEHNQGFRYGNAGLAVPVNGPWGTTNSEYKGAARDSGKVVMVDLATGIHYHVSVGRKSTTPNGNEEVNSKHHSGEAKQLPGWVLVGYDGVAGTGSAFNNEVVFIQLNPSNSTKGLWRCGFHRSDITGGATHYVNGVAGLACPQGQSGSTGGCSDFVDGCYVAEPHAVPSPSGTRVMFESNWQYSVNPSCQPECYSSKAYILDMRGPLHYFVAPSGSDLSNGLTPANAWRTIAAANAGVTAAGFDATVHLGLGQTYVDAPNPATAADAGHRYQWIGDTANPDAVKIAAASGPSVVTSSNQSIKGVTFPQGLRLSANRDSIADCIVSRVLQLRDANYNVLTRLRVDARNVGIADTAQVASRCVSDTITNSTLVLTAPIGEGGNDLGKALFRAGNTVPVRYADSLLVQFSRIEGYVLDPNPGFTTIDPHDPQQKRTIFNSITSVGLQLSHATNFTSRYNTWFIVQRGNNTEAVSLRDSSAGVTFNRDSILAHGDRGDVYLCRGAAGSFSVTVDSSYVSTAVGTAAMFTGIPTHCSLTRSTFVTGLGRALDCYGMSGSTFDHNTFVGTDPHGGIVSLAGATYSASDTTKFTNNIVYAMNSSNMFGTYRPVSLENNQCALYVFQYARNTAFVSNWNLYSIFGYHVARGDASIGWCCNWGTSTPYDVSGWRSTWSPANRINADSLSIYGGPDFDAGGADTTFRAFPSGSGTDSLFNSTPGGYSAAIGAGKDGTDIGAVAHTSSPVATFGNNVIRINGTGGFAVSGTATVTNTGTGTLTLGTPIVVSPTTASWDDATLGAGESATLTVTIAPGAFTRSAIYSVRCPTTDPQQPLVWVRLYFNAFSLSGGPDDLPEGSPVDVPIEEDE